MYTEKIDLGDKGLECKRIIRTYDDVIDYIEDHLKKSRLSSLHNDIRTAQSHYYRACDMGDEVLMKFWRFTKKHLEERYDHKLGNAMHRSHQELCKKYAYLGPRHEEQSLWEMYGTY